MEEFGETIGALADTIAVSQFVKSVITDSNPESERFTKDLYDSFAVSLCRNLFYKFEAGYNVMVIDESIPRPPKDLWEVNLKGGLCKVTYDRPGATRRCLLRRHQVWREDLQCLCLFGSRQMDQS